MTPAQLSKHKVQNQKPWQSDLLAKMNQAVDPNDSSTHIRFPPILKEFAQKYWPDLDFSFKFENEGGARFIMQWHRG